MRMCNMCSVAATRGALITQQQPQRQQNQRYANLTVSIRRKRAPLTFGLSSPRQRERDSYPVPSPPFSSLLCTLLPRGADFPTANVYIYICMCWCVPVCVRQNYICYTHTCTQRDRLGDSTHTHTCSEKKNKIFVMSLLSHIKVQVQPI